MTLHERLMRAISDLLNACVDIGNAIIDPAEPDDNPDPVVDAVERALRTGVNRMEYAPEEIGWIVSVLGHAVQRIDPDVFAVNPDERVPPEREG